MGGASSAQLALAAADGPTGDALEPEPRAALLSVLLAVFVGSSSDDADDDDDDDGDAAEGLAPTPESATSSPRRRASWRRGSNASAPGATREVRLSLRPRSVASAPRTVAAFAAALACRGPRLERHARARAASLLPHAIVSLEIAHLADLGDACAAALARALRAPRSIARGRLTALDLTNTGVSARGAAALALALGGDPDAPAPTFSRAPLLVSPSECSFKMPNSDFTR